MFYKIDLAVNADVLERGMSRFAAGLRLPR
jgi:hypothetical protein